MIPVYKPYLTDMTIDFAKNALDSSWISSYGRYLDKSKFVLDQLLNSNALLVNNGTSACHLMAKLLKHKYPDINKVIVPNNVYVAAWNALLFDKEYKLHAVDADINTWNYNLDRLYEYLDNADFKTTALLVVHNVGNIVNVPQIKRDYPGLVIIEDNCEGIFGQYEEQYSGTASFASTLSFFGNKTITSGEGGAVILQSTEDEDYLQKLRGQGQSQVRFKHDVLGYNYRMTNIQAALLYGQLLYHGEIRKKKSIIFDNYKKLLNKNIHFQVQEKNTRHSEWMCGIRIEGSEYNKIEDYCHNNDFDVRPMFYPINAHKHLENTPYDSIEVATKLNKECVILPSFPELSFEEQTLICGVINSYAEDL